MIITIIDCFLKGLTPHGIHESMAMRTVFNLLCGLSDQHKLLDLAVKGVDPFIILGLFIISATDQKWIPWIAASGFVPLESL